MKSLKTIDKETGVELNSVDVSGRSNTFVNKMKDQIKNIVSNARLVVVGFDPE